MMNMRCWLSAFFCAAALFIFFETAQAQSEYPVSSPSSVCCAEVVHPNPIRVVTEPNAFGRDVATLRPGDRDISVRRCYNSEFEVNGTEWEALWRNSESTDSRERLESLTICEIDVGYTIARGLRYHPPRGRENCGDDSIANANSAAMQVVCTDLSSLRWTGLIGIDADDQWLAYDYLHLVRIPRLRNSAAARVLELEEGSWARDYYVRLGYGWLPAALSYIQSEPSWTVEDIILQIERDSGISVPSGAQVYIRYFHSIRLTQRRAEERNRIISSALRDCIELIDELRPTQRPRSITRTCIAAVVNREYPSLANNFQIMTSESQITNSNELPIEALVAVGDDYALVRQRLMEIGWQLENNYMHRHLDELAQPSLALGIYSEFSNRPCTLLECYVRWVRGPRSDTNLILVVDQQSGLINWVRLGIGSIQWSRLDDNDLIFDAGSEERLISAFIELNGESYPDAREALMRSGWQPVQLTPSEIAELVEQQEHPIVRPLPQRLLNEYSNPVEGEWGYFPEVVRCRNQVEGYRGCTYLYHYQMRIFLYVSTDMHYEPTALPVGRVSTGSIVYVGSDP